MGKNKNRRPSQKERMRKAQSLDKDNGESSEVKKTIDDKLTKLSKDDDVRKIEVKTVDHYNNNETRKKQEHDPFPRRLEDLETGRGEATKLDHDNDVRKIEIKTVDHHGQDNANREKQTDTLPRSLEDLDTERGGGASKDMYKLEKDNDSRRIVIKTIDNNVDTKERKKSGGEVFIPANNNADTLPRGLEDLETETGSTKDVDNIIEEVKKLTAESPLSPTLSDSILSTTLKDLGGKLQLPEGAKITSFSSSTTVTKSSKKSVSTKTITSTKEGKKVTETFDSQSNFSKQSEQTNFRSENISKEFEKLDSPRRVSLASQQFPIRSEEISRDYEELDSPRKVSVACQQFPYSLDSSRSSSLEAAPAASCHQQQLENIQSVQQSSSQEQHGESSSSHSYMAAKTDSVLVSSSSYSQISSSYSTQYASNDSTQNASKLEDQPAEEPPKSPSLKVPTKDRPRSLDLKKDAFTSDYHDKEVVIKTPTKRKISSDSCVLSILNSGKFGGYKINEVIHEATVIKEDTTDQQIFKEAVEKKDRLKQLIIEESADEDQGIASQDERTATLDSFGYIQIADEAKEDINYETKAGFENTEPASEIIEARVEKVVSKREAKDEKAAELTDQPVDTRLEFEFPKSTSLAYKLGRKQKNSFQEENRVSISGEAVLDDDEYNSILEQFKSEDLDLDSEAELDVQDTARSVPSLPQDAIQITSDRSSSSSSCSDRSSSSSSSSKSSSPSVSMLRSVDEFDAMSEKKEIFRRRTTRKSGKLEKFEDSYGKMVLCEMESYELYSYPVQLSPTAGPMREISHYLDLASLTEVEKESVKIAVLVQDTPDYVDVETFGTRTAKFTYPTVQDTATAVVVSKRKDLPLQCRVVPLSKDSRFFIGILAGPIQDLRRHIKKPMRKCGYENNCVLRRGQSANLSFIDNRNRNTYNMKLTDNQEFLSVHVNDFVPQDFIDILISTREKTVIRSTMSLYNLGRLKEEIPSYERSLDSWELITYEGDPVDCPAKGRISNLEPLYSFARNDKLTREQLKSILLHLEVNQNVDDLEIADALKLCITTWKKEQEVRASVDKLVKILQLADVALNQVAMEIVQNIANTRHGMHFMA